MEENYLKAIYHLSRGGSDPVSTNALADNLRNRAASVTDMIKRMAAKGIVSYEKYKGVKIGEKGKTAALEIIRKHRLWETFLVEKLGFSWEEVHEVAEQLEHIQSTALTDKLDAFLGHPAVDPHGHPIPDRYGNIKARPEQPLSDCQANDKVTVISVHDDAPALLQLMSKMGIHLGAIVQVTERREFDASLEILIDNKLKAVVSKEVAENLMVTRQ